MSYFSMHIIREYDGMLKDSAILGANLGMGKTPSQIYCRAQKRFFSQA